MIVKTIPHSEYPNDLWQVCFEHKGASANICILQDARDTAYLYQMYSKNRRKGEASELLAEINEYCIANKISLVIEAAVYDVGKDGIKTNRKLKAWYERNGALFVEKDKQGHPMLLLGYRNW